MPTKKNSLTGFGSVAIHSGHEKNGHNAPALGVRALHNDGATLSRSLRRRHGIFRSEPGP